MAMMPSEPSKNGPASAPFCQSPIRRALWAAALYLLVGLLWILFSDRLAEAWFPDPAVLSQVQTWKGLFFVLVTGLALFLAVYRQLCNDRVLLHLQYSQRRALRQRERQLTVLMDNLPGMAYRGLNDEAWTMLFVSAGCERLTGYSSEDIVLNQTVSYKSLIRQEDVERVDKAVAQAVAEGRPFSVEYALNRADGTTVWVWERGRAVNDIHGEPALEGVMLDISDRKLLEQELETLATTDPLTGLLNRRELERMLSDELQRCGRYGHSLALLWIDFDHFKRVNDTFGHAAGDRVLTGISDLLRRSVRGVDAVARFGGEELVIVLPEMTRDAAHETAERLRRLVAQQPITLDSGEELGITISVGLAVYPDHGDSSEALCAAADRAMYVAKSEGRNRVVVASETEPAG